MHSTQTAEDIVKLLCRPGTTIILVFRPQRRYQFQEKPLQRGRKKGVEKFCDFPQKSPYISETLQDMPTVTMER